MTVSLIAAIGLQRELGYKNDLLWHIPADLKRFKALTSGHTVIMGRRTFDSIDRKPLANRKNIIITSRKDLPSSGIIIAHSVNEAIDNSFDDGEVFILGGATIYEQFLPLADRMYLTLVKATYKADTFFPDFNRDQWKIIEQTDITNDEDAGVDYSFITFSRIN